MKRVLKELRSMRFGILLLALIAAGSLIGSLMPQGREYLSWYAQQHSDFVYKLIYRSRIYDIYHSWYFQLLVVLLCLNLILCSAVRLRAVLRGRKGERDRIAQMPNAVLLSSEEQAALRQRLRDLRCREDRIGTASVFYKNGFGRWGSMLTHLSILLTVILGAAALYLPTEQDESCLAGESIVLEDGTEIAVDDFTMMSEEGKLDYATKLRITLPDGRESGQREVKVNHPTTFGHYKIYQWQWGVQGSVVVESISTGEKERFTLSEGSFLSEDGENGIWYMGLLELTSQEENGPPGGTTYEVYQIYTVIDGVPSLMYPASGESIDVGDLRFTFQYPYHTVLRVKQMSPAVNGLLIGVFALMVSALYITFFCQPVLVKVDGEGCVVGGPKPEAMQLELSAFLENERAEKGKEESQ